MTVTNRSSEPLGVDASVEAVFKATPEYFGRDNSDDTGVIVRQTALLDVVPNFDGLTPGESVTVPVSPWGLKAEDSLLEFERRIVVRGTLGTERGAVVGLHQRPQQKVRRTLSFNGGTTPYFERRNYGAAQIYSISDGALAFGHPSLQASSGVYMNAYSGGRITFRWYQEAFGSRFRLINGDRSARIQIGISTNTFHDQRTHFDAVLAPFEERTIELPEGTARFSVLPYSGWVAIDDVSWEYVVP